MCSFVKAVSKILEYLYHSDFFVLYFYLIRRCCDIFSCFISCRIHPFHETPSYTVSRSIPVWPVWSDELLCLHPSPRVSGAPNGHQPVPAKASRKWLVQPASREAEAENNWDCPALPQQATGAWVLHLALPRSGGRKASPLMPLSCPNTGSQAHTTTHTHTHSYTILIHHLQLRVIYTHTHTQNLYIYTVLFCYLYEYIYQHCLPLTLRAKCQKPCQGGKSNISMLQPLIEWLKFYSDCLSSSRVMLCGKKKKFLLVINCNTIVTLLAFLKM